MSINNQDLLFQLIHSLGKGEKRHFKLHSKRHVIGSKNNYVRLFDAVSAQKQFDKNSLRKEGAFSHFRVVKNRLYGAVLNSLEEFHSSQRMEVRSMLNRIEILFNKSLFANCRKLIRKAKLLAQKNEMFESLLEIIHWEYRIAIRAYNLEEVNKCIEEEAKCLQLYSNYKLYFDLANRIAMKYQQIGHERNEKGMREVFELARHPQLRNSSGAHSFRASMYYYEALCFYALAKGNFKKVYVYSKKMIDLFGSNQHMISLYPSAYLGKMNKLLIALTGLKKYDEMFLYLQQLKEVKSSLKALSDRTLAFFYQYQLLNYYIWTGRFAEAESDLKLIERELPVYETKLNPQQRMVLYLVISETYFGRENYKRALYWLNKVVFLGELYQRKDIESFTRMFSLIIHYELRSEPDFMASLFRSAYRFLYKRERLYKFEVAVMNFIKQNILREPGRSEMRMQFRKLKSRLEDLGKDPYEKHALEYFDYISWLESKIENRTFAEVIKGKWRD